MEFLIGLFLDHALNHANVPYAEANSPVLVYHYGTFNQLFAWHSTSIGEM